MKPVSHPSSFIDSPSVDIIRQHAAEAERMRSLHPEQLAIIYNNRWFNLYVPEEYGGLGLSLPKALPILEALGWADGSVG